MLNFTVTFLTYWEQFQMLGEEPFVIRRGLLYLWNKLSLGVKCRFAFGVVLCFYMELQIWCAVGDTGMYTAPPSDQADELSKDSLWHWKYLYALLLWETWRCTRQWLIISKIYLERNVNAEMSNNYKTGLFHAGVVCLKNGHFILVRLKYMQRWLLMDQWWPINTLSWDKQEITKKPVSLYNCEWEAESM